MMECWVYVVIFATNSILLTTARVTPVIIAPSKTSGVEAALILVPGALISGEAYRPLALEIQRASELKLWLVLLEGFLMDTPNPLELSSAISSAIDHLNSSGMTTDNVFVAGHSLGGVFVGQYGQSPSSHLKGILLYAAYLTHDVSLDSYPVPVLTISGDLDGQTRITRIVDTFQDLQAIMTTDPSNVYRKPVVVMRGVSHAQFASGPMPPAVVDKDLTPEVSAETAYSLIANHTSAFLVASLRAIVSDSDAQRAIITLQTAHRETLSIMTPLITMKTFDANNDEVDQWAIQAQYLVAGLTPQQVNTAVTIVINWTTSVCVSSIIVELISKHVAITNHILPESDFLASKPTLRVSGPSAVIATFAHVVYETNLMDVSTIPSSPKEVAIKMKSNEAVRFAFPNGTTFANLSDLLTCKDINQAAFQISLQSSSPDARRRFQTKGRPVFFLADIHETTGLQWSNNGINIHEDDQGLHVASPVLHTPEHEPVTSVSGMHYCKVLAPYRTMEWIYVDSLRDHA